MPGTVRGVVVGLMLVIAFVAWAGTATWGGPMAFMEGEAAPELKLPSLDDATMRTLADFRGKPVVLHVFASW